MSELNHFFVTLVRHGQTTANKIRQIQGQSDTKLSEEGIKQSKQLSQHFDCSPYNLVFSSDLSRALDTCQIIVNNKKQIITDVRLRERSFGPIEGKSLDELKQLAAEKGFANNLSEFTPIGGESLPQVRDRVIHFFNDKVIKLVDNKWHVLIVTHGGVIREIMKYFQNQLKCDFKGKSPLIITPNTSLNQFKLFYNKNSGLISAECLKIHDISHLSGESKASALNEEQINDKPIDGNQEAL